MGYEIATVEATPDLSKFNVTNVHDTFELMQPWYIYV